MNLLSAPLLLLIPYSGSEILGGYGDASYNGVGHAFQKA